MKGVINNLKYEYKGKEIIVPLFHNPGEYGCRCITCKLAQNEISIDFYLGYRLAVYISRLEAQEKDLVGEDVLQQAYDPAEMYEFVMES